MTAQLPSWERAVSTAASFNGSHVVYCITFTHGLMKIGATKNLPKRLCGITSHGLFRHMVDEVTAVRCPKKRMFPAEKLAIQRLKEITKVRGPEIFDKCDLDTVVAVIKAAVSDCTPRKSIPVMSNDDYERLARDCNLHRAFYEIALDRGMPTVIDGILLCMGSGEVPSEMEWLRVFKHFPAICYSFVTPLIEKNAVLIGRGVDYDSRKTILAQYAIDLRPQTALAPVTR
jgi:hypothetical protein